jgi:hypothetical protein
MKKQIFVVIVVALVASSFTFNSELYLQGYTTGQQIGSSETYAGQNYQLYSATMALQLDPEYQDYKTGVMEGYLRYKFVGSSTSPTQCTFWNPELNDGHGGWDSGNCSSINP